MSHSATSPRRTSRRLSGLQNNHNETLIAARPARLWGLQTNHDETRSRAVGRGLTPSSGAR